jgi:hypothetical protein
MMSAVSESSNGKGAGGGSPNEGGVLANLPRTRPQRASARRVAARRSATQAPVRERKQSTAKRAGTKTARAKPVAEAAPTRTKVKSVTESAASTTAKAAPARAKTAAKPKRRRTTRTAAGKARPAYEEAAPRQGFEGEGEAGGSSIQPPGGAELVASAAEIVGELAKAGVSRSERLLKDVLSRLPLS